MTRLRPSRGIRRIALVVATLGVVAAVGATPALAFWVTSGTATAGATARTLASPAPPSVGSATQTSLVVSGTLPTAASQVTGTTYSVKRDATTLGCSLPASGSYSCTDTALTGGQTYTYTIVAALGTAWQATSVATTGTTLCPTTPKYTVTASSTTPTAGTSFTVTVTATNCSGVKDTTYNGTKAVTFSGPSKSPSGKAPAFAPNVNFTNGVGTATVTLYDAETTTITATQGALAGTTASLTVGAAAAYTIVVTNPANKAGPVTLSCDDGVDLNQSARTCTQTAPTPTGTGRTWKGTFTVVDSWGNPRVNNLGTAINLDITVVGTGDNTNATIAKNSTSSAPVLLDLGDLTRTITASTNNTSLKVTITINGAG
ncbi:hypothetical protein BJ986_001797 [Phycicoccus badiiscoriae]|uniref:Fibronectin type-III domain-containing protein n=1 Tax=Pedococcus badiiscoriae TaxID=642776 RepID=A0A852WEX7_9MICO|nr:hypothetical protein [Pedococcus badiiscoriae]NYG07310.1 hypothetical protein [Pedococcus badiiscoriae]